MERYLQVMLALDSLREEMEDLQAYAPTDLFLQLCLLVRWQNTKAKHVKCEEWTEAAHIVSDVRPLASICYSHAAIHPLLLCIDRFPAWREK